MNFVVFPPGNPVICTSYLLKKACSFDVAGQNENCLDPIQETDHPTVESRARIYIRLANLCLLFLFLTIPRSESMGFLENLLSPMLAMASIMKLDEYSEAREG